MFQSEYIRRKLSYIKSIVEDDTALNLYDINRSAEDIFMHILNDMYSKEGWSLKNANDIIENFPAIDLIDIDNRIVIQVTSEITSSKVKETITNYQSFANDDILKQYAGYKLKIFYIHRKPKFQKETIKTLSKLGIEQKDLLSIEDINKSVNANLSIADRVYQTLQRIFGDNPNDKLTEGEKKAMLQDYYEELERDFTTQSILGNDRGMALGDIYIEPQYEVLQVQTTIEKEHYNNRFVKVDDNSIHHFLNNYFEEKNHIDTMKLQNANMILLLGQAGQGKTSFCKKVMYDSCNSLEDTNYYMVRLRDIGKVDKLLDEPIETIAYKLENILGYSPDLHQKSVLLLDGLDELAMKERLVTEAIDEFLEMLLNTLKDYPNLKIILTSRTLYINLDKMTRRLKNDILTLHLKAFDFDYQSRWIEKYQLFYPDTTMTQETLIQLHQEEDNHILELIEQPILLHMVAQLNLTHEELTNSTNRAQIYQNMFDSIIKRKWENGREHENLKGLEADDMRELLQTIAFEIYKSDYEYIHKKTLEKLPAIKEFYQKIDIDIGDKDGLNAILKGVLISFYFQEVSKDSKDSEDEAEDNGNYAIEFMHKSLQEYLVAEKIFDEILRVVDKGKRGKYFINDYKGILQVLWELFSYRELSSEIRSYLIDIIQNHKDSDEKLELADRLATFLPELFEKDFLYSYSLDDDSEPMQKSLNVFYGYWTILSNLGGEKNYIEDGFRIKIASYFSMIIVENIQGRNIRKGYANNNLSYQNLTEAYLVGIHLDNANLSNCTLDEAFLESTFIEACDFSFANLNECALSNSYLSYVNFSNTFLEKANFRDAHILNCDFTNANLNNANLDKVRFVDNIFKDIKIDDENARYLEEQGVEFTRAKPK